MATNHSKSIIIIVSYDQCDSVRERSCFPSTDRYVFISWTLPVLRVSRPRNMCTYSFIRASRIRMKSLMHEYQLSLLVGMQITERDRERERARERVKERKRGRGGGREGAGGRGKQETEREGGGNGRTDRQTDRV